MVSIIVPTYNYGRFIADCLASVQNQSYANWECIIVDNASTDNTEEVCKTYAADTRIKYVKLESNNGPAPARNHGLSMAKGTYILFLDADDCIEKDKLKTSVDYLAATSTCDLVYSDMRYFKDGAAETLYYNFSCNATDNLPWMSYTEGAGLNLVKKLLAGNIMVISSPIFKADILQQSGAFDERIAYNEDWDLWLRLALNDCAFHYLAADNSKALIRTHITSTSRDVFKMQVCGLYVLVKNAAKLTAFGLTSELAERKKDHSKAIAAALLALKPQERESKLKLLEEMKVYSEVIKFKSSNHFFIKLQLRLHLLF